MIVVVNRIPVAEGHESAFEELFARRAGMVEKAPGFVRFELLRPTRGDYYQVVTHWTDEEAYIAWTSSDAFRQGHGQTRPAADMFRGQNVLEQYDVIQEAGQKLS